MKFYTVPCSCSRQLVVLRIPKVANKNIQLFVTAVTLKLEAVIHPAICVNHSCYMIAILYWLCILVIGFGMTFGANSLA